ncbi:MAG: endonuclease/exonuclease/phosphatase family protein, partial [Planctomycetota bacterium]
VHPTIVAGDFNFTPDSVPYQALIDAGWVDTAAAFGDPKPTYPSKTPRIRIDYVFVRPAERWRVLNVQVLDEPAASDHAPVLVELEYIQP